MEGPEQTDEKMKIAVASAVIGKAFAFATLPGTLSRKRYCSYHGYDLQVIKQSLDPERAPAWSKIKLLQNILPNYDWVFWSDADSIIKNLNIPLTQFIDEDFSFIVTKDARAMNTGEFLIKNTPTMLKLLHEIYEEIDHTKLKGWEQFALLAHLKAHPEYLSEFKFLHQRDLNSYLYEEHEDHPGTYQKGDFVLHFPGIGSRTELFEKMWTYSSLKPLAQLFLPGVKLIRLLAKRRLRSSLSCDKAPPT